MAVWRSKKVFLAWSAEFSDISVSSINIHVKVSLEDMVGFSVHLNRTLVCGKDPSRIAYLTWLPGLHKLSANAPLND